MDAEFLVVHGGRFSPHTCGRTAHSSCSLDRGLQGLHDGGHVPALVEGALHEVMA